MAYTKQTWQDDNATYPLSATRMSFIENGIFDAHVLASKPLNWRNVKTEFGAVGDGVADDTTKIQSALDAAVTEGGGTVFLPTGTYRTSATLTFSGANVRLIGAGLGTTIQYMGTGTAISVGNKTSGSAFNGNRLEGFRILGTSGALIGLHVIGCQVSRFESLRIEGLSNAAAVGLVLDTQSTGTFVPSSNNTFVNTVVTGCTNGIRVTKDASDTGADGSDRNVFIGTRVSTYSGVGIDVVAGEGNSFFGTDAGTSLNAVAAIRINDHRTSFYQVRADCTFAGNSTIGFDVTATGGEHLILMPSATNAATEFRVDPEATNGQILGNGYGVSAPGSTAATTSITAIPGLVSTNVQGALAELADVADDAGVISSTTAKVSTNSTTLSTDTDFNLPIAANEAVWITYELEFQLAAGGGAGTDVALAIQAPTGATLRWSSALDWDQATDNAGTSTTKGTLSAGNNVANNYALGEGIKGLTIKARIVNGATAGTVSLRWAQGVANAASLTRMAYSHMEYRRL